MYALRVQFKFEAAHRLVGHPKCGALHGHSYLVTVKLSNASLHDGMLVDLDEVHEDLDFYIKPELDHCTLVGAGDSELSSVTAILGKHNSSFAGPTTVEVLAKHIATRIWEKCPRWAYLVRSVEIQEGFGGTAEFTL